MKTIISQYILVIGLTLTLKGITLGTERLFPDIGWHILSIAYLTLFALQVTFYYLTTNFKIGWTISSFIINFILWTIELVVLEKSFHNTWIYQDSKIASIVLGGILWATNKILLDKLFLLNKSMTIKTSKLEQLIKKAPNAKTY